MKDYQSKTTYDKIVEVAAIAALLWAFCPLFFYNSVDNNTLVPVHYNLSGEVDGWSDRTSLWVLPSIALLFYVGLSMLQRCPYMYNYPCEVTKENADHLYRMGVQLVRHVKVLFILIFAHINNASYAIAIGKSVGLNLAINISLLAAIFLTLIIYVIKMLRYKPKM